LALGNLASLIASFKIPSLSNLKKGNIPQHVAIILDGNGRWAERKNLPRIFGHKKGAEVLKEIIIASRDIGIKYLTAYSFSSENWQRPEQEVKELMNLFVEVLRKELEGLIKNDVRLKLIGNRKTIPEDVLDIFEHSETVTKNNKSLILNIAFNYGSRQEIIDAVKELLDSFARKQEKDLKDIDTDDFSSLLYTAGVPDPDLLIRTSGEYRLSNFLLWQMAYTELYFTKTLWPDFNRNSFYRAIYSYQQRHRRFGRT
jgi:undecaprenyl diphosphate synthase